MPTPQRTPDGKWVLYSSVGQRFERWPVDARDMLASGDYTADDPTGDTGVSPSAPVESPAPEPAPETLVPGLLLLNAEHSPGVPILAVSSEPAKPVALPTGRGAAKGRR